MRCDDFLPYLETGSLARRLLARCHAARCRPCAGVYDAWVTAKQQLSSPEPLSPHLRHLWQQAADETLMQPQFRRRPFPRAVGLAAAACLLMGAVVWTVWNTHRLPPTEMDTTVAVVRLDASPVRELDTSNEFASLETCVKQLDVELGVILRETERLDARHQASEMLDRYSKW